MLSEREWLLKRVPFSIGHEFKLTQSEGIVGRRGWVLFNFVRRSLCIRVTMALGRTFQLVGRGRVKGGKSVRGLEVRIEWMTERGPSGRGITSFIGGGSRGHVLRPVLISYERGRGTRVTRWGLRSVSDPLFVLWFWIIFIICGVYWPLTGQLLGDLNAQRKPFYCSWIIALKAICKQKQWSHVFVFCMLIIQLWKAWPLKIACKWCAEWKQCRDCLRP